MHLPSRFAAVILAFAPVFRQQRTWRYAEQLLIGAILAPGKRTVTSLLRIAGLSRERRFVNYHRVLNRAAWSTHTAARLLLDRLIATFVPTGPVVLGIDDTIERRRGKRISAKGIYRDPVRSSKGHFVKASGLRWLIRLSKIYETCLSSLGRFEEAGMASATEFRALARVERDPRKRVRLLAIANVQDGMTIEDAARTSGMGRATLYRWLARERTGGAAALGDRSRSGRRRKLDAEQRAEVKAWVLAGPEVERDGIVAWRGGDVRAMIEQRFAVKLALSSTYRLLSELHLSALVPRPCHSEADPAAQAAFEQTSRSGWERSGPA